MEENCVDCQGCVDNSAPVMPPQSTTGPDCSQNNPCSTVSLADCVIYNGNDIECGEDVVVSKGSTTATAIRNIVAYFCQQFNSLSITEDIICNDRIIVPAGVNLQEALELIVEVICAIDPEQGPPGPAGASAYKFVHEESSIFDGDIITISRQALEYCNLIPPACSTDPVFADKVCDLHVSVYYLLSNTWIKIPPKPFGIAGTEGYLLAIDNNTGDMRITISVAPIDPAVQVRVVILA